MMLAVPPAEFVFVQAGLALLGLELGLDVLAPRADLSQRPQRCVGGSIGQIVFEVAPSQVPPGNKPTRPSGHALAAFPNALRDEVIGARPLSASGNGQYLPARLVHAGDPLLNGLGARRARHQPRPGGLAPVFHGHARVDHATTLACVLAAALLPSSEVRSVMLLLAGPHAEDRAPRLALPAILFSVTLPIVSIPFAVGDDSRHPRTVPGVPERRPDAQRIILVRVPS